MRTWSFYDLRTGQFVGRTFASSNPAAIEANTPAGCGAVPGIHDQHSRRVQLETGEVVDYQPPSPGADFSWNTDVKRWMKRPEIVKREMAAQAARDRIAALERSQARALREIALGDPRGEARARLVQIDAEIAALRPTL